MNENNDKQAVDTIADCVIKAIKKCSEKFNYDRTFRGRITNIADRNGTKLYTVLINNSEYKMYSSTEVIYDVGTFIYALAPQGNKNKMFIIGRAYK